MTCINPQKFAVKISSKFIIRDPIQLYMFSKSIPRVLEDMEVPNEPGDDGRSMVASL